MFGNLMILTATASFRFYAALPYGAALSVTPVCLSVCLSVPCHRWLENGKSYNVQTERIERLSTSGVTGTPIMRWKGQRSRSLRIENKGRYMAYLFEWPS